MGRESLTIPAGLVPPVHLDGFRDAIADGGVAVLLSFENLSLELVHSRGPAWTGPAHVNDQDEICVMLEGGVRVEFGAPVSGSLDVPEGGVFLMPRGVGHKVHPLDPEAGYTALVIQAVV